MSENPSPEEPKPAQSFGAAPGVAEPYGVATGAAETLGAAPGAAETSGTAPGAAETFGTSPGAAETFGTSPGAAETFGTAPGAVESFGSAPSAASEPAPKKRTSSLLTLVIALVVVVVGVVAWFAFRDNAVKVGVGQCITGSNTAETDAKNIKVVDCAAANATFKVVQRVENTKNDGTLKSCRIEEREAGLWIGKEGEKGTLLCLITVKK